MTALHLFHILPFYWTVISIWPLYHTVLIGGVLQKWLSFWKILPTPKSPVRVNTWVFDHLLIRALLPQLLRLAGQPALGTILVLLPFTDDEGTCSVPLLHLRSDISLEFMAWFVLWHALLTMRPTGLSKSYPVNWFYLQSNCRDVWQMISGNRIQLSLILSVLAKDMNTNVHVIFYLYIWKNFKQRSVWERSTKDHSGLSWNSRGCPGSARAGRRAGKLVKWAVEFSK